MKNIKWITISEAAKLMDRGVNGARMIVKREKIPTRFLTKGKRINCQEVSEEHCAKVSKGLPPRKFVNQPTLHRRLEKRTGYVKVYIPRHHRAMSDGYVYDHWLVAESMLGRPLGSKEQVHHINRVRNDNRPVNLKVYKSRSEHMKEAHSHNNKVGLAGVYENGKDISPKKLAQKLKLIENIDLKDLKKLLKINS